MIRFVRPAAVLCLPVLLAACTGSQSALHATGDEAERVRTLFWVMTIGGAAIMAGVAVLAFIALRGGPELRRRVASERLIIGGGLVFPVVTLSALLIYGLVTLATRASSETDEVFAEISGEQWWWRVTYRLPDGQEIASANELRIPVGRPVVLELKTADVLHSFWVPNLAGKLDMVPGRSNFLTLLATEPGISRGQCAEYCGGAHAFMSFYVVALAADEFEDWRAAEAGPAVAADGDLARGAEVFGEAGCGACHAIRGTGAMGVIGPDLTHVGGRHSLAAATLPNDAEAFANWIRNNQHIKPGNKMPPIHILSDEDLTLLAGYLESLK